MCSVDTNFTLMEVECFINLVFIELETFYLVLQCAHPVYKHQLVNYLHRHLLDHVLSDDLDDPVDSPEETATSY